MYPRVKVRQEKDEDAIYAYELGSLPSLKAFESMSDFASSADSPTSVVRISRACILSPDRHGLPSSRGRTGDKAQSISGGNDTNARSTSVPRPRAVLSSPENDQIIRSKMKAELLSGLKNHNSCQSRHTKCKLIPKSIQAENPTNANRGSKEPAGGKSDPRAKARARLVKADPSQRVHSREGNQGSVCSK